MATQIGLPACLQTPCLLHACLQLFTCSPCPALPCGSAEHRHHHQHSAAYAPLPRHSPPSAQQNRRTTMRKTASRCRCRCGCRAAVPGTSSPAHGPTGPAPPHPASHRVVPSSAVDCIIRRPRHRRDAVQVAPQPRRGLADAQAVRGAHPGGMRRAVGGGALGGCRHLAPLCRRLAISLRNRAGRLGGRCFFDRAPCGCVARARVQAGQGQGGGGGWVRGSTKAPS